MGGLLFLMIEETAVGHTLIIVLGYLHFQALDATMYVQGACAHSQVPTHARTSTELCAHVHNETETLPTYMCQKYHLNEFST